MSFADASQTDASRNERVSLEVGAPPQETAKCQMSSGGVTATTAPVDRLPPEILLQIFNSHRRSWSTFYMAHVCRYWRELALSSPPLWAKLDSSDPLVCVRTCLARSLDASLSIRICDGDRDQFISLLLPHVARIHELDMYYLLRFRTTPPLLHLAMPRLEVLRLRIDMAYGWPLTRVSSWQFDPSPSSFPLLRSISLHRVFLPWGSLLLRAGLTHLEFSGLGLPRAPGMDVFLDILGACPELKVLVLRLSGPMLPRSSQTYADPTRQVALQKLQRFSTTLRAVDTAHLLEHLALPETAQLELSLMVDFLDDNNTAAGRTGRRPYPYLFSNALPRNTRALAMFAVFESIQFVIPSHSGTDGGLVQCMLQARAPAASLRMSYVHLDGPGHAAAVFDDIARIFAASPVRALQLSGRKELAQIDACRLIGGFPSLMELVVSSTELAYALPRLALAQTDAMPLAQKLQRLVLENWTDDDEGTVRVLLETLRWRTQHGLRLESLVLVLWNGGQVILTDDVWQDLVENVDIHIRSATSG